MPQLTLDEKQELKRKKEAAHRQICADYKKLREKYPTESAYCLFETMAKDYRVKSLRFFPWSGMGVKNILIKYNLYQHRK